MLGKLWILLPYKRYFYSKGLNFDNAPKTPHVPSKVAYEMQSSEFRLDFSSILLVSMIKSLRFVIFKNFIYI